MARAFDAYKSEEEDFKIKRDKTHQKLFNRRADEFLSSRSRYAIKENCINWILRCFAATVGQELVKDSK